MSKPEDNAQNAANMFAYGPQFDGRYAWGLSTNPDMNRMFAIGNMVAAQLEAESYALFGTTNFNTNGMRANDINGIMNFAAGTQQGLAQAGHGQPAVDSGPGIGTTLWYTGAGAGVGALTAAKIAAPKLAAVAAGSGKMAGAAKFVTTGSRAGWIGAGVGALVGLGVALS